ncbi:MAG TPA: hypothetical protein VES19_13850 [Candidatus Limnocylindrales bacterium]|nr:hypothetical protein [Candidatus Limnocylindrales bacterium]
MTTRPIFQHQGPDTNCVIRAAALGWKSCTAYAMAMLIDAATDGAQRPKGCRIRRLVRPEDITKGLNLSQVAAVAERSFDVVIAVRTGANAIAVDEAVRRVRRGRGFVLQGNNSAWGLPPANHAVYVHEVRGGPPGPPRQALLFDPQRRHERWVPWQAILDFGAALTLDEAGLRPLGPARLYAGFAPRPAVPADLPDGAPARAASPAEPAAAADPPADGVTLRFGARRLLRPVRRVARPPAGRLVNVRRSPRSLSPGSIVETLGRGAVFVAYQKARGMTPAGARSSTWLGNRDATEWVHVSGLRRAVDR